jgi:hypothetical protein
VTTKGAVWNKFVRSPWEEPEYGIAFHCHRQRSTLEKVVLAEDNPGKGIVALQ